MRTLNSRFGMIPHKGNINTRNEYDISSNDECKKHRKSKIAKK